MTQQTLEMEQPAAMPKPDKPKSQQEVAVQQEQPPAPVSETGALLAMIERAARDQSVDIDKMERLMGMHDAVIARRAKTEYSAALSAMQPELPIIVERGKIDIGRGKPQSYALWEDINEKIKPVLAKYGFALSFRTGRMDDKIVVTGILSHRGGHSEETTMQLPLDTSGSKNNVQAVGSSTSYGKRYTASALLNLTSRGEDDDGKAGGGGFVTEQQVETLQAAIVEVGADIQKFCAWLKVEKIEDIPANKYEQAIKALEAKRGKE